MTDLKLQLLADKVEVIEKLIVEFKDLNDKERYQKIFQAKNEEKNIISTAVWLLSLREKAQEKFNEADIMFFNSLGLEQSSSQRISEHIASRFQANWQVCDLSVGIGANALAIAKKCQQVLANDSNEETLFIAKLNAKALGLSEKMEFSHLKAEELVEYLLNKDDSVIAKKYHKVDAFFLDPDRNREAKTKTRSIINSSPNLLEILPKLFAITKNVGIKISPAFDYQEIEMLPEEPEIEIISENNSCKVAMLWFGDFKRNVRSATCLRKDGNYLFSSDSLDNYLETTKPAKYIYEADKALTKSHLVNELASKLKLTKISHHSNYLTSDLLPEEIKLDDNHEAKELKRLFNVFNIFEVVSVFNSSFKDLKKQLSKMGVERVEIKAKNHFLKVEEIYKKLNLKEGGDFSLLFLDLPEMPKGLILMKRLKAKI